MKTIWFFDLDGTLADTDKDIRLAWKAALADLGLECPRFDELFVAGPPIDEMTRILFPERFTPELADAIRAGFGRHYDNDGFPETKEYPGIIDAVLRLKAAGARVFIATNKRYAGAMKMAEKFRWHEVFEKIYAGDMYLKTLGRKFAKPALLAKILEELGAKPEDAVMVGDTENDFAAARANGIESIGVRWGYGKREDRPDRWIEKAEELMMNEE